MRRLNLFLVAVMLLAFATQSFSQEKDTTTFKPSGRIIARSFFDYSKGFGSVNN